MPRRPTGSVYERSGAWYAKVTVGMGKRQDFRLPTCKTEQQALTRKDLLAEIAAKLRGAGLEEQVPHFLERAAAREGHDLKALLTLAQELCRGEAKAPGKGRGAAPLVTFADVANHWTSGEVARDYPDRVQPKKHAAKDRGLLRKHVLPLVGDIPLVDFKVEHADAVLASLPEKHAQGSRQQIAMLVSRILGLAAFPLRIIPASPLPKGWIPKRGTGKALSYLYPDEDARLLRCERVPLCYRVYYGFLDREGMRGSEAEGLTWADVDLERGAVTLDVNKTDDPRAWALGPGVASALAAWKRIQREEYGECTAVFVDDDGEPMKGLHSKHRAESFRAHLLLAGVDRAALHERSEERRPIRAHDLRATFITIALANGKTEAWVADRTGHRSSHMINRYRRAARTVAELGLGELRPLDEAIPELGRNVERNVEAATVPLARSDRKPLFHQARSTRPGSSRGTAGGSPRRSRTRARRGSRW